MTKKRIVNIIGSFWAPRKYSTPSSGRHNAHKHEPDKDAIGRLRDKVGAWILWILIVVLTLSLVRNITNSRNIKLQVQKEQAKVDKIKNDNATLEAQIAETQSQAFVEKEVRDKLGLAKDGEAIVVLPDEDTLRKLAPIIPTEQDFLPDPNWKRWLKLFL